MRALNAERSTYPNSMSHRLTHSTFPILKLHHVELPEQRARSEQQKEHYYVNVVYMIEKISETRLCQ